MDAKTREYLEAMKSALIESHDACVDAREAVCAKVPSMRERSDEWVQAYCDIAALLAQQNQCNHSIGLLMDILSK
jgi:hypothetical protein